MTQQVLIVNQTVTTLISTALTVLKSAIIIIAEVIMRHRTNTSTLMVWPVMYLLYISIDQSSDTITLISEHS
jgi:hypothetical protein